MATVDKFVTIVTSSGDYQGTINLNLSQLPVDRVSDLFVKSDINFLPLYDTVVKGQNGKEILVNVQDIAAVIPHDKIIPPSPELRQDVQITVKLKFGLGQLRGKVNLLGETQQLDRISDLLNFPGKRWLILYETNYKANPIQAAILNLDFISTIED